MKNIFWQCKIIDLLQRLLRVVPAAMATLSIGLVRGQQGWCMRRTASSGGWGRASLCLCFTNRTLLP